MQEVIIPEYAGNMQIEHKIWNDYISKGLIILPLHCPKCNKNVNLND